MKSKIFTLTADEITSTVNESKELFLNAMKDQKLLTQEQVDEMNKYCLALVEKSFFGKVWDKLWKNGNDTSKIIVVKIIE